MPMQPARKLFRIEVTHGTATRDDAARDPLLEIISELKTLRTIVTSRESASEQTIKAYQAEIAEAHNVKRELEVIHVAINQTKREIAALHVSGFKGQETVRATDELDAVVDGTLDATEQILSAAELIDRTANALSAATPGESDRALCQDIQGQVVRIFEACNFQDLTGQRIAKVVAILKFIEQRVIQMTEIWGGVESLREMAPVAPAGGEAGNDLVNGPKLDGDAGHASQDDIDALFA
jgi:chemotaxis protein CheZ